MHTIQDVGPANIREAFINGSIDLSLVNPDEIACMLRVAVLKNDVEYATVILDHVPEVLLHDNGGGRTLWQALENGNEFLARKLVLAGANLNYQSRNGSTFLHSYMDKYEKLAILMIERGADINITDRSGKSVLYAAVRDELYKIIDTITGLDIKYKDESRILKLAASSSKVDYLLPTLIRSSDIETQKSRGRKALIQYLQITSDREARSNLVKYLIDASLLPNYTNSDVIRILQTAVTFKNHVNVVKLLLDCLNGNLNGKSEDVASLLCNASKHSRSIMSTLLIQRGADVNAHTKEYDYPLHVACRHGSMQNIHLLLSLGANPTITNVRGLTPLCCMGSTPYNKNHKLVIRYLAILSSRNIELHESDTAKISRNSRMQIFYDGCLSELWNMKKTRIHGNATFYCFFDKTVEELSDLVRHVNFLRTYYLNQTEGCVAFRRYSMHIHNIFKMAIERKNILLARAKIYEEAAMNAPPYGVMIRMTHDMPELDNFERKFYFRLHERINDKNDPGYNMNLLC